MAISELTAYRRQVSRGERSALLSRATVTTRPLISEAHEIDGLLHPTPTWIENRLCRLSELLTLSAPVRGAFQFKPDSHFYGLCSGSVGSLELAFQEILDHVGLRPGPVRISFKENLTHGHAAQIKADHLLYSIDVSSQHRAYPEALGAILAHECRHIVCDGARLPRLGTVEDEVHVDLAAMLCGLGKLILKWADSLDNSEE